MKKMLTAFLVIIIAFITFSGIVSAGSTMSAPTSKVLLIYANGDRYEGDFINGMFHGKGIFIWAKGDRYDGDFFLNKRTGKGIYLWASGESYEGDFVDGKLDGWGIYTWPDGAYYEGEFINNERGNGIYVWSMDDQAKGKVKNDKFGGRFIFLWPKKNRELSDYFLGKLHAKGFLVISDGNGDFVIGTLKNKVLFILSRRAI